MDLNLIDLAVLGVLAFFALLGWYRGLLSAVMHFLSVIASFLTAAIGYRQIANFLIRKFDLLTTMMKFTDAGEAIGNIELSRTVITAASQADIDQALAASKYPTFVTDLISKNIKNQAFSDLGLSTLEEYFNQTLGIVVLNVVCYVALFLVAFIICELILGSITSSVHLPVLRRLDPLAGAAVGLITGIFVMQVVFALVPTALTLMSMDTITKWFTESSIASKFYNTKYILNGIKGTLLN